MAKLVARGGSKVVMFGDTVVEKEEEQLRLTAEREKKEAGKTRVRGWFFSNISFRSPPPLEHGIHPYL